MSHPGAGRLEVNPSVIPDESSPWRPVAPVVDIAPGIPGALEEDAMEQDPRDDPADTRADDAPGAAADADETTSGSSEPATVALSVAGAARGLGVAAGTLRSWERRYGLGPSAHTAGGHRRYGPVDLARLGIMHRLVQEGVPPAEAAAAAIRAPVDAAAVDAANPYAALLGATSAPAGGDDVAEAVAAVPGGPAAPLAGHTSAGGGRVLPMPSQARTTRGLARAAMALDSAACHRAITDSLREHGALPTYEHLVRPVLVSIGQRWAQTSRGVEIEHSFSAVVTAAFTAHSASLREPRNGRPALLATVPDDLHDLPLLVLQAALADVGIRCHVLGARTPDAALQEAILRIGPPVVFLWAQMPGPVAPDLPSVRPAPALVVGGPGWVEVPGTAVHAGDLGDAVGAVRATMGL